MRQANVKFYQAQVDSSNDRLKIGEGTKIDVSQAQARLAQGVAAYESAVAALQTSQASYERYVGHKPKNLSSNYNLGSLMPKSLDSAVKELGVGYGGVGGPYSGIGVLPGAGAGQIGVGYSAGVGVNLGGPVNRVGIR